MQKPSIVDIRVMANKIAQTINEQHTVYPLMGKPELLDSLDEHQLTNLIAEPLKEYFGVTR